MSRNLILQLVPPQTATIEMQSAAADDIELSIPRSDGTMAKLVLNTTAVWETRGDYVPASGVIVVYSDRTVNAEVTYAGVKIGDGETRVGDLPFVGDDVAGQITAALTQHAGDSVAHVTQEDRDRWNASTGELGDLAYKDSASGEFTPEGTVGTPEFTGTEMNLTGSFTPEGTVSAPTFTGTEGNVSVTGTPAGTIGVGSGTANYTPEGTVSAPEVTVTPETVTGYVADSATGGGSKTDGTAASCTLPVLQTSVADETLTIAWTAGSFTANVPTAVTLPTFGSTTIVTGIQDASASAPAFTGEGAELTFTGDSMTGTGTFTPQGTVSQPVFTGTGGNVTVTGTPEGTVSAPAFTGTQGTVTVS